MAPASSLAERCPDVTESVKLPHLDLARATIERGEIVAVDCSSATGDRAGRPLGAVILIPSDAVLGRQVPSRSFPYKKTAFGYRRRVVRCKAIQNLIHTKQIPISVA